MCVLILFPRPGTEWTHELASEMMFADMVETYQLDISPEDATLVKALISGEAQRDPYVPACLCVRV